MTWRSPPSASDVLWIAGAVILLPMFASGASPPMRAVIGVLVGLLMLVNWWMYHRYVLTLVPALGEGRSDCQITSVVEPPLYGASGKRIRLGTLLCAALMALGLIFALAANSTFSQAVGLVAVFSVATLGNAPVPFIVRRQLAMHARDQVNTLDGRELCVNCGYDLHGTPSANCPECGATFTRKP